MSLRTLPTIEAGIVHREDLPGRTFIEYQPGDGTRYSLIFTDLQDFEKVSYHLGCQDDSVLVTLVNFSMSMVVAKNNGFLSWRYVHEKMGDSKASLTQASAFTLAEIIAHMTGREATTPQQAEQASTQTGA
jgi:hypothetical protein